MPLFARRRGDAQPTAPAAVLLATPGPAFSAAAIAQAAALAGSEPVAVLSILRIHGSSMGLPNPGLMPNKKEWAAQRDVVDTAIQALQRRGAAGVDGQVAATRRFAKTIARVARVRAVRHVVLDEESSGKLRRFVEGDLSRSIRRRLRKADVDVQVVPSATRART